MKPYGQPAKNKYKIHPADECSICAEKKEPNPRRARAKALKEIFEELNDEPRDVTIPEF